MYMSKIYAVYDMQDYEQCVGIYDNVQEIADKYNMTKGSVLSGISKENKIEHRYLVKRIDDV